MNAVATCRHHWLIEAPDAEHGSQQLEGRCRNCNATRMFPVSADRDDVRYWGDTSVTHAARERAGNWAKKQGR